MSFEMAFLNNMFFCISFSMEELHHENVGSRNERTKFRRAETLPVRFAASDSTGRRLETKSSTFSSNTPFSSQRNPQYSSRKGFRPREEPHQSTTFLKRRPHKRSTFLNDVVFGSGAQRVSRETASEYVPISHWSIRMLGLMLWLFS